MPGLRSLQVGPFSFRSEVFIVMQSLLLLEEGSYPKNGNGTNNSSAKLA